MTSSFSSTMASTARGSPIGFAASSGPGPDLRPAVRSLLGGWVILATVPLLWSWFALALRMP